jgi:Amt family ammonium transporter
MLQSFMAMIIVTLLWVVVGFSLSFGSTIGGFIGDPTDILCFKMSILISLGTIPFMLFALFQAKFAIITPALITGAFAKNSFWAYMLFMVLFILFVYTPLCHMTWHVDISSKWAFLISQEELWYT